MNWPLYQSFLAALLLILVETANPKTVLFLAAMIPQLFRNTLDQQRSPAWQRWTHWLSGGTFIGIGLAMLLHDRPKA